MKIGSYNIRVSTGKESVWPWKPTYWVYRMKRIANLILAKDLDVVMIQEGYDYLQLWVLKKFLKDKYLYVAERQGDRLFEWQYNAVFYKKELQLTNTSRFIINQRVDESHRRVACLATFNNGITIGSVHVSTKVLQMAEFERNLKVYLQDNPTMLVLGGDYNCHPDSWLHPKLVDAGIVPIPFSYEVVTTFNGFDKNEDIRAIIDYIYVTKDMDINAFSHIKVDGDDKLHSDHLLIYTEYNPTKKKKKNGTSKRLNSRASKNS